MRPYFELHQLRRRPHFAKKDSKAAPETRLSALVWLDRKRALGTKDVLPDSAKKHNGVDELHLASALDEEVAQECAQ